MDNSISYEDARTLLLDTAESVGTEVLPLELCGDRVLAETVTAAQNVPAFDCSPYDGYAFRAADSTGASRGSPVTLRVLEEVAAGSSPRFQLTEGTAVRIMTGAPIPAGADAVVMVEKTEFTDTSVTVFSPAEPGENIIRAGEDVLQGSLLAETGCLIDAGTLGTFAAQGIERLRVFRVPKVGIISTGSELTEPGALTGPGKIYNSNRYTLTALLTELGCEPDYLGSVGDDAEAIAALIRTGLDCCDAVILTGGVSVGDFDLTPAAMKLSGVRTLFQEAAIKPGMTCCYGVRDGRLVCALSGNPASAVTNFHAITVPALKKVRGMRQCLPQPLTVTLLDGFPKKSPVTRLLRGKLDLSTGEVCMALSQEQGNVVLSSTMGCDAMAVVPAGSGPVAPGTKLKGFMLL